MRIIATIGPKSANREIIHKLINNGVDTFRLNFSHFYEKQFIEVINEIRNLNEDISIMADLCGKKVRIYKNIKDVFKVFNDEIVFFCSEDVYEILSNKKDENFKLIPLTLKSKDMESNDIKSISMKDGTMNFEIMDKNKMFLKAKSKDSGVIRGGKGCNVKGLVWEQYSLSNKDKENIKWALNNNINIIGQSFVENSREILELKKYIESNLQNKNEIKIFSKIETNLGLKNYKEILNESQGVIIARGDLVPECGLISSVIEEMALLNNLKNEENKKEIIIATHLLDSMKYASTPTITEVESIYNFLKYGANGFLLAGETSIGKYPVEATKFLKEIINIIGNL